MCVCLVVFGVLDCVMVYFKKFSVYMVYFNVNCDEVKCEFIVSGVEKLLIVEIVCVILFKWNVMLDEVKVVCEIYVLVCDVMCCCENVCDDEMNDDVM